MLEPARIWRIGKRFIHRLHSHSHLPTGFHLHRSQGVLVVDLVTLNIPQIYGTSIDTYTLVIPLPFLTHSPPFSRLYCTITIRCKRASMSVFCLPNNGYRFILRI